MLFRSGSPKACRSAAKIQITTAGIHLANISIFRLWHAPLFIPWEKIEKVEQKNEGNFRLESLHVLHIAPDLKVTFTTKTFYKALANVPRLSLDPIEENFLVVSCNGEKIGQIVRLHQQSEDNQFIEVVASDLSTHYYIPLFAVFRHDIENKEIMLFANKNDIRWNGWGMKPAFLNVDD